MYKLFALLFCISLSAANPRVARSLNVLEFGARGNGIADDYASITNMVYSLGASNTFYFPAGEYLVSKPIFFTNAFITVKGDGRSITKLRYTGPAVEAPFVFQSMEFDGDGDRSYNFGFNAQDITFEGNSSCKYVVKSSMASHSNWLRVGVRNATNAVMLIDGGVLNNYEDLTISSKEINPYVQPWIVPTNGLVITSIDGKSKSRFSNSSTFKNLTIEGTGSYGLVLDEGTGQCTFLGGTVEECGAGILLTNLCNGNSFYSIDMELNTGDDLTVRGNSYNNSFVSCLFYTGFDVDAFNNTFIGGRAGYVTLGSNATGTLFNNLAWKRNSTNVFTDNSFKSQILGMVNLQDGTLKNQLKIDSTSMRAPLVLDEEYGDTNFQFKVISEYQGIPGVMAWHTVTRNGAYYGYQTNITWDARAGNIGLGFRYLDDTSAKLSVNGGINVGSTNNPGTGSILASGSITATNFTSSGEVVGSLFRQVAPKITTTNYTILGTNSWILANCATGAVTLTLPSASTSSGIRFMIKKIDSTTNVLYIAAPANHGVDGQVALTNAAPYMPSYQFISDGNTNWYVF